MNLHSLKFYCLPDDYEVVDSALDDIKYVCRPVYTQSDVRSIDRNSRLVRAQDGQNYRPGVMGLNNIKANDYCNAVLQVCEHEARLYVNVYLPRRCRWSRLFAISSYLKPTTLPFDDRPAINCSNWRNVSVNCYANYGIHVHSKRTSVRMSFYRRSCCAVRSAFRLRNKVCPTIERV